MYRNPFKIMVILLVIFQSMSLTAQEVIYFQPDDKKDFTSIVRNKIESVKSQDIKIIFEKGIYNFKPDFATEKYTSISNHGNGLKRIAFLFEDFESVEINGNEAEFIFHGQIAPFQFFNCRQVKVKDLVIDWKIPFSFQGDVIDTNKNENWFEIKPYTDGYSWKLKNGRILFPNIDGFNFSSLGNTLVFDKDTKRVSHGALDLNLRPGKVEARPNGILRIYDDQLRQFPKKGKVIHSKGNKELNRYAPAFHGKSSKNLVFDNILIHHALGMGFLFERAEDIQILNSGIYIKEGSDRVITTIADATHFVNCKGEILIANCRFEGMLDDGANVHGTYAQVDKILNDHTLLIELKHFEQTGFEFAGIGDEVWFISSPNPTRGPVNRVNDVNYINERYSEISFDKPLPKTLNRGDLLENKTWNPEFVMRDCIIRDHRARNILIKTPKKILIENNKFSSMMSSIMLRGESYFWFESGAVADVEIRNNLFTNSVYGGTPGHAILNISPRLGKSFDPATFYDRNIRFVDNTIETFGNRIIKADRVDGLLIKGNTIIRTTAEEPLDSGAHIFELENSNHVKIIHNTYKGNNENIIEVDAVTKKTLEFKNNEGLNQ